MKKKRDDQVAMVRKDQPRRKRGKQSKAHRGVRRGQETKTAPEAEVVAEVLERAGGTPSVRMIVQIVDIMPAEDSTAAPGVDDAEDKTDCPPSDRFINDWEPIGGSKLTEPDVQRAAQPGSVL